MAWLRRSAAIIQGELMTASFLTQAIVDNPNALRDEERVVVLSPFTNAQEIATGNSSIEWEVVEKCDQMELSLVGGFVSGTAPTGAGTITIQVRNVTQAVDMLTTEITIDSTERSSRDAATPPVIDTSNNVVDAGDIIAIDIDGVPATTPGEGLDVRLEFKHQS